MGQLTKKCQLSSKVLFHFHELCRLRLRKTRGGDLPGLGGRRKLQGLRPKLGTDEAMGAPQDLWADEAVGAPQDFGTDEAVGAPPAGGAFGPEDLRPWCLWTKDDMLPL